MEIALNNSQLANIEDAHFTDSKVEIYLTAYCRAKSRDTYRRQLRHFAQWLVMTGASEQRITAVTIASYRTSLETMKPRTANGYIGAVKRFFKWVSAYYHVENIADGIQAFDVPEYSDKMELTDDEMVALVRTTREHSARYTSQKLRDEVLIMLMLTQGLRCCEITRACVSDYNFSDHSIAIHGKGHGTEGKKRTMYLSDAQAAIMEKYIGTINADGALFPSRNGGAMSTRQVSRMVKCSLVNAGIDDANKTAHSLRYSYGVSLIMAGCSTDEVAEEMGHSNTRTTKKYTHRANERMRAQKRLSSHMDAFIK